MKVLGSQSVGAGPDLMAFDDGRHLLYVASHSGIPSVFDDSAKAFKKAVIWSQALVVLCPSQLKLLSKVLHGLDIAVPILLKRSEELVRLADRMG